MPKLDGFEVCRRLKNDPAVPFIPIILVTARAASQDVVTGLDAGADEYLTKPIDQAALVARVRSMLRVKALHDQVQAQATDLAAWNHTLEQRVNEQVTELDRMNRLKCFLSPQIAKLVVSSGDDKLLESHRRDITVVFCDLRGFTAFAESAEPEDIIAVLQEYYQCLGESIDRFEGTYRNNKREGFGHYSWTADTSYEGLYANDVPNGPGTAKVLGETFVGDWKNGCFVKGTRVVAIGVERSSCAGFAAELEHSRTSF